MAPQAPQAPQSRTFPTMKPCDCTALLVLVSTLSRRSQGILARIMAAKNLPCVEHGIQNQRGDFMIISSLQRNNRLNQRSLHWLIPYALRYLFQYHSRPNVYLHLAAFMVFDMLESGVDHPRGPKPMAIFVVISKLVERDGSPTKLEERLNSPS